MFLKLVWWKQLDYLKPWTSLVLSALLSFSSFPKILLIQQVDYKVVVEWVSD